MIFLAFIRRIDIEMHGGVTSLWRGDSEKATTKRHIRQQWPTILPSD